MSQWIIFITKTKIIIHRSNNLDQSIFDRIENVNSTKLLGVLISDSLKWNNHIGTTLNEVSPYYHALIKTDKIFPCSRAYTMPVISST